MSKLIFENGSVVNPDYEQMQSIGLYNILIECMSEDELIELSKSTILNFCPFQEHLRQLLEDKENKND